VTYTEEAFRWVVITVTTATPGAGGHLMHITYDEEADALWIQLPKPDKGGFGEDLEDGIILHRDKKPRRRPRSPCR
jgi:hypothetical protein